MYEDQQRARPYGSNPQTARVFLHNIRHGQGSGRLVIFALIAGLLGIAVGVASLTLFLSYKSTVTAQMREMRQAVAQEQSSLSKAQSGNASSVSGLSSKVTAIGAGMAALAPYSSVCSQDLTGPNGPAQFYFLCTDQKP